MTIALIALGIFGSVVTITYQYRADKAHEAEVKTVREEQQQSFERVLKHQQDGFAAILDNQQKDFAGTISGLEGVIHNSDREFTATMGRTNTILDSVTGGKSFAIVVPMVPHINKDTSVPLAIENHGDRSLTGISATVYSEGVWMGFTHESIMQSVNQRINVGTLSAGERLVVAPSIFPDHLNNMDIDGEKVFRSIVYIAAQNYTVEEYLDFKKGKDDAWLFRYKAYRLPPSTKASAQMQRGSPELLLEASDWTSDPNQLKFTRNITWH
jgi:Tfp pilus assembly protein PilE